MKQRRQFIKKAGGLAALLALGSTARARAGVAKEKEGSFLHVVFFWLVDDSEETHESFLKELRTFINNVDLMKTKHIGTPAGTNREVIDSSWSYSLILSFDSKKEQDLYQEHQLHKNFIENASALWKKVQVYDSIKL